MALRYTTPENIEHRLSTRIKLSSAATFATDAKLTEDQYNYIGNQKETIIDMYLRKQYKEPFNISQVGTPEAWSIISEIAEKLIIGELVPIQYSGFEDNTPGGFGKTLKDEAMAMLKMIGKGELVLSELTVLGIETSVHTHVPVSGQSTGGVVVEW